MAGQKFLQKAGLNGAYNENEAIQSSTGAPDAGKIPGLDGTGRLDLTFMPVGIAPDVQTLVVTEAIAAGDFINVFDSAGLFKARKADASNPAKEAHGFVLVAQPVIGGSVDVYFIGPNTSIPNVLTPGMTFLDATTPGRCSNTEPTGTGQISQRLGAATSASSMVFQPGTPTTLA